LPKGGRERLDYSDETRKSEKELTEKEESGE